MNKLRENISNWLQEHGWDFSVEQEGDDVRFTFSLRWAGGLSLPLEITIVEDGQFLQLRVPQLFPRRELESSPLRRRVLSVLAEETYLRRLAKVGYDPDDGEIDCCVDLPLEDCPLTRSQFDHMLHLLIIISRLIHKRVMMILQTGRDPGALDIRDLDRPD